MSLHANLPSLVDTVSQRLIFYLWPSGNSQVVILRPTVNKVVMNIYERLSREWVSIREEANGADKGMVVCYACGWVWCGVDIYSCVTRSRSWSTCFILMNSSYPTRGQQFYLPDEGVTIPWWILSTQGVRGFGHFDGDACLSASERDNANS